MKTLLPTRCLASLKLAAMTVGLLGLSAVAARAASGPGQSHPAAAPHVAAAPHPAPAPPAAMPRRVIPPTGGPVRGAHLGQWMQQHSTLTPDEQQRALQNEPGFRSLPPGTQANVMSRLNRLNTMPEQQRARVIEHNEFMERMTPQERGDVRSAMGQLSSLPPDRRIVVSRAFRQLRNLPLQQRNAVLTSPQYQQLSDEERGTLGNLLAVAPMLPPTQPLKP